MISILRAAITSSKNMWMRQNYLLCSSCFQDSGLRKNAEMIGIEILKPCRNCAATHGKKLNRPMLLQLTFQFFVRGTTLRSEYGAAPILQFNDSQYGTGSFRSQAGALTNDTTLLEETLKIGIFHYGPRLWMIGEIEPLKALQKKKTRPIVIKDILNRYPKRTLSETDKLYRIRLNPENPNNFLEYDSPPDGKGSEARFSSKAEAVLYASQDLEVCIHECRMSAEDEAYVSVLSPTSKLNLLDLSHILEDDDVTEFESLDEAINLIFLAGKHSYEITRDISHAAKKAGLDGIIYPSYFSILRTGAMPLETVYGLSTRRIAPYRDGLNRNMIRNAVFFGRPVSEGKLSVQGINKLTIAKVKYDFSLGPVDP